MTAASLPLDKRGRHHVLAQASSVTRLTRRTGACVSPPPGVAGGSFRCRAVALLSCIGLLVWENPAHFEHPFRRLARRRAFAVLAIALAVPGMARSPSRRWRTTASSRLPSWALSPLSGDPPRPRSSWASPTQRPRRPAISVGQLGLMIALTLVLYSWLLTCSALDARVMPSSASLGAGLGSI